MKTNNNKYTNEIWNLHQKASHARGMDSYGIGWKFQREYYQKLSPLNKREYEDAVLILCHSDEVQKANFALFACGELAKEFSVDWANRVVALVETLVKKGLQPRYKNTITDSLLRLIWIFSIHSLIPHIIVFREQITINFKQGILSRGEWEQLYFQVSRILIKVSSEDFWLEFKAFHQDQELLNLLGDETKAVIHAWISFGALIYGLNWLSKMVAEYSGCSDEILRAQVLLSIQQSFSIVVSTNPSERASKKEFLDWAKNQLAIR
jgi:hypothetical protein